MAFALPGARGEGGRTRPQVLAVMGDGAPDELQEIETAVREQIPLVVLIWADGVYGLIERKMDLELGEHYNVTFTNPDVAADTANRSRRGGCVHHRLAGRPE
jgi:acetolactate synthase-1/2/3 large subunit